MEVSNLTIYENLEEKKKNLGNLFILSKYLLTKKIKYTFLAYYKD